MGKRIEETAPVPPEHGIPFGEALRVWVRVALYSFGGPAGQMAVMHRILVEEKRWISENRFLHALNYTMLLPGPEAQQLATYVGWLLHRTRGGLLAGTLFVLPGFVSILLLSLLYAQFQEMSLMQGFFFGLKPAVMAIVVEAMIRIGRRALQNRVMITLAAAAFVAIFFFEVPFPLIILAAGAIGFAGGHLREEQFSVLKKPLAVSEGGGQSSRAAISDTTPLPAPPSAGRSLRILLVWLALWFGPLVALASILGTDHLFVTQGLFFSKAAVVTFGGAYAVLAYIAQEAVNTFHWLLPGEMLDGLAMAETTPGPLIQVVQFVGFMGAYRFPGSLSPITAGVIASILTTWVTFIPSFLWIFLGAPYVERLRGNNKLTAALSAITAAVTGVILNLALWFSLHTLFGRLDEFHWFGLHLLVPVWTTWDAPAMLIAVGAFVALLRFRLGMLTVLASSAAGGLLFQLLLPV